MAAASMLSATSGERYDQRGHRVRGSFIAAPRGSFSVRAHPCDSTRQGHHGVQEGSLTRECPTRGVEYRVNHARATGSFVGSPQRDPMGSMRRSSMKSSLGKTLSRWRLEKLSTHFEKSSKEKLSLADLQELWRTLFEDLSDGEIESELAAVWGAVAVDSDQTVTRSELIKFIIGRRTGGTDIDAIADMQGDEQGGAGSPSTLKEWAWAIWEQHASEDYDVPWLKKVNFALTVVSQIAIALSIVVMIIESLPAYQNENDEAPGNEVTFSIEAGCIGWFTLEVLCRAVGAPSQRRFWLSGWTAVDVLSCLPFYLDISGAMSSDSGAKSLVVLRVLRMARLIRVLRVLKLGRHSQGVQILVVALSRSSFALGWLAAILVMAVTLFGAILFAVEKDDSEFEHDIRRWRRKNDSELVDAGLVLEVQSIPDCMWWALVTLTTVGYGDITPKTALGKVVGSLTMYVGLLVVAFPVTILCNVFQEVYAEFVNSRDPRNSMDSDAWESPGVSPHFGRSSFLKGAPDGDVQVGNGPSGPTVSAPGTAQLHIPNALTTFCEDADAGHPMPLPLLSLAPGGSPTQQTSPRSVAGGTTPDAGCPAWAQSILTAMERLQAESNLQRAQIERLSEELRDIRQLLPQVKFS